MRHYQHGFHHGDHDPRVELHPDYLQLSESKEAELVLEQLEEHRDGARVFHRIAQTIHRAIPTITLDQAKDAAHALLEDASRRRATRGRR